MTSKWNKNKGGLYLIPSKRFLDDVLIGKKTTLLKTVLDNFNLPKEWIILIDSGPDHTNIEMSLAAADLVFVPMMLGQQDVHPTVETIHSVLKEQEKNGKPILGGLIVNGTGKTQWEDFYISSYQNIVDAFKNNSGLIAKNENIFIEIKRSRIIQRGTHLSWSWRKDLLKAAKQIGSVIKNYETETMG